jgi:hypothetical protein
MASQQKKWTQLIRKMHRLARRHIDVNVVVLEAGKYSLIVTREIRTCEQCVMIYVKR